MSDDFTSKSEMKRLAIQRGENYDHLADIIYTRDEFTKGDDRKELKKGGYAWRKREKERKMKADEVIERAHNRAVAQHKYYLKNKEELNAKRRLRNITPKYAYRKSKLRALANEQQWDFDFDSWIEMWLTVPRVVNPKTGFLVTAWSMRGPNASRDTQMVRRDTNLGWSPENCEILFKGEPVL
jgi:hypothetical protein